MLIISWNKNASAELVSTENREKIEFGRSGNELG
jgi:hypothetical protein